MTEPPPALALNWVFGTSSKVHGCLVNLSDSQQERLCYVAAHTGVIYDKSTRKQTFLQGHCNSITSMLATEDRSTIITADQGNGSLLVLWNARTGSPLKSIAQPHAHGIQAMQLSPDGEWLATISAPVPETGEQEVALWRMSSILDDASPQPAVLSAVPAGDVQLAISFNMNNTSEIITNGRRRVYFWSSSFPASRRFKYYSPPLRSKDFKQSVGDFVMSVFVPGSLQALTATTDGDVVVWDEQGITAQMGTRATDRRASKLMRLHQQAITHLSTIGDYIVSGARDGFIRFHDPLLRIVAWFEDLDAGPITGVSFSTALPAKVHLAELADTINRFMVPDFVVMTEESRIVDVCSAAFEEFDASRRRGAPVLEPMLPDAVAVVCHPFQAECCVLGRGGMLQRWDLMEHRSVAQRALPPPKGAAAGGAATTTTATSSTTTSAHCVAYARDASFLAVGMEAGFLHILDTRDLSDVHTARNTTAAIVRVATSMTGGVVAVADASFQVLMYAYLPYKHIKRWELVGKAKTHFGAVVGLVFGETPSGATRLFSLGADGRIVEYDLQGSSPAAGLKVVYHQDSPPPDTPTALAFAPPLPYYKHSSSQTLLLIADDAYKIKLYCPEQRACLCTFLGPTFSGPIQQLDTFQSPTDSGAYLAYATAERVVGLVGWPMDGDPANSLGLIAHPGEVGSLSVSHDGRRLVTEGPDGTLCVWSVSTSALRAQAAAAASTHAAAGGRWAAVLDDPDQLEELRDYFVHAQVKALGEDTMAQREIQGRVPVPMVPDLMRAAGFYPSNAAIADLMAHIEFMAHSQSLDALDTIDFETFLSLYSNHKPLADVSTGDIMAAFDALDDQNKQLSRNLLVSLLQQLGESMAPDEIQDALEALTGAEDIEAALPQGVDAACFAIDVLGFEEEGFAAEVEAV